MSDLKVSLKYCENVVLFRDEDGNKRKGNSIEIIVNQQVFKQFFKPSKTSNFRQKVKLLGNIIELIGSDIAKQAEFGKQSVKILPGGQRIISF